MIDTEPLARTDYVSAADPHSLTQPGDTGRGGLLWLAVRIGKTRLIDNVLLPESSKIN